MSRLIEATSESDNIKELRDEVSRLMARIDEAVIIQAELRDQLRAKDEEITRLRQRQWGGFFRRKQSRSSPAPA